MVPPSSLLTLAKPGGAAVFGLSVILGGLAHPDVQAGSGLVAPGQFIWGVNGRPLGGDSIYTGQRGVGLAEQMQWLKGMGAGWYRADGFARDPVPGIWEVVDELDAIMPAAQAAGIEIYPTLHAPFELRPYGNLLETHTLEQIYQTTFNAARQTAEKWAGQIKIWDLMNEPDGWTLSPDKAGVDVSDYYADKLAIAATMLRAYLDGVMFVEVADFSTARFDRVMLYDAAVYGEAARFDNIWLSTSRAPVPEPATLALLGLGSVGAGLASRRRIFF